jgi:uncharacterized coiled-coil DUF342 family protein
MKKNIQDLIKDLSDEEKDLHKNLIQETLERDKELKEIRAKSLEGLEQTKKNLDLLAEEYINLAAKLEKLKEVMVKVQSALEDLKYTQELTNIRVNKISKC